MPYKQIRETELEGVFLIEPKIFGDNRGWYCPQTEIDEFERATKTKLSITQEAESFNNSRGVLRGLHYQKPNSQGKLVRVISGSVFDVVVDLRKDSFTFGKYLGFELTAENFLQLWVPVGFAHGYLTLSDNTRFSYLISDGVYDKNAEKGVNPFDTKININWMIPKIEMNILERDANLPNLENIPEENLF